MCNLLLFYTNLLIIFVRLCQGTKEWPEIAQRRQGEIVVKNRPFRLVCAPFLITPLVTDFRIVIKNQ